MKNLLILLISLLVVVAELHSQDLPSTFLINYSLGSILRQSDYSGNSAVIVGDNGVLLRMSKNPITWEQFTTIKGNTFTDVLFMDSIHCVIVGRDDSVGNFAGYFSDDAGKTWRKSTINKDIIFERLDFLFSNIIKIDSEKCISISSGGYVLLSENRGQSWKFTDRITNEYSLKSTTHIMGKTILTFRDSLFYRSSDLGLTWSKQRTLPVSGNVVSCTSHNDTTMIIVHNPIINTIYIVKSVDFGDSWVISETITSLINIVNVFYERNTIFALRSDSLNVLYYSDNNGEAWKNINLISANVKQLSDIRFISTDSVLLIGGERYIGLLTLHNNMVESISDFYSFSSAPLKTIRNFNNRLCFFDSKSESICFSTNSGATWQKSGTLGTNRIVDFYFPTHDKGFALEHKTLYGLHKSRNSGEDWVRMEESDGKYSAPYVNYRYFSFIDSLTGIISVIDENNRHVILLTLNGGDTWEKTVLDSMFNIYQCQLHRTNEGDIVCAASVVKNNNGSYRTSEVIISKNYGITWERKYVSDSLTITDLFVNNERIIVIGYNLMKQSYGEGCIYVSSDGGEVWEKILIGKKLPRLTTIANNNNIIVLGGSGDSLIISDDYGKTWKNFYYRPTHYSSNIEYTLTQSLIVDNTLFVTGFTSNLQDPNPVTKSAPIMLRIELPEKITSITDIESTDPLARVWIFSINPNPVTKTSIISLFCDPTMKESFAVELYTLQGIKVADLTESVQISNTGHGTAEINAGYLPSGMYLLKVSNSHTTRTQLTAIIR